MNIWHKLCKIRSLLVDIISSSTNKTVVNLCTGALHQIDIAIVDFEREDRKDIDNTLVPP